ncbi:O-methyltransferase [Neoactinobaculum massilliense]|uniref:O-methyltransferase n=1 Tax=Neoactinobaculum massilliense TaxID=2364794 RepID=UPI000F53D79D|nr:O-methyltransferase [Neoactinobaculum massilliense]
MADHTQEWAYAEERTGEDHVTRDARQAARELGVDAMSPAAAHFLAVLARLIGARTAVEIGTGTGVSGLHLLGTDGLVLTTIDTNHEAQMRARSAFHSAGVRSNRTRIIEGTSTDILPRLASGSYDLVLIDGDPLQARADLEEALRLLRRGGLAIVAHAFQGGHVPDPARREENVVAMRNLLRDVEAEEITSTLVPIGDGVLVVVP